MASTAGAGAEGGQVGDGETTATAVHGMPGVDRRTGLRALLEALPGLHDRGAVALAVTDAAAAEADAHDAALLLGDGGPRFAVLGARGGIAALEDVAVDEVTSPLWQAALGRGAVAWRAGDGPLLAEIESAGWRRALAVGVPLSSRRTGVLLVGDKREEGFDGRAADAVAHVAAAAALGLDAAAQREDRRTVERLLSASVVTAGQLVAADDPDALRRRFLQALVKDLGVAGAALWAPDPDGDGTLRLTGASGLPGEVIDAVAALSEGTTAAKLSAGGLSEELARAGAAAAHSSWSGRRVRLVPLRHPDGGVLGVYHTEPLDSVVDGVLGTLAQTFAAAMHQTTLHARARTVVDALQEELRPRGMPPLGSGLDVGWVYRSATAGVDVGGDFFDVLRTDTGHVGVACGDVSGKGVEAASLTAMAVHSLRAYALHGSAPAVVLRMLNAAVCEQTAPERFVTIAYLRLDPDSGHGEVTLAGHPPPMLVGPGRAEVLDIVPDLPAGVDAGAHYVDTRVTLEPGEALVLYTDGVTEARGGSDEPQLLGLDGLAALLRDADADTAQQLADAVWDGVQQWTEGGTTDDCAIVVVRRTR